MKDQKEVRVVLPVGAIAALKQAALVDNRPLRSYLRVKLLELVASIPDNLTATVARVPAKFVAPALVPMPQVFVDLGAADCPNESEDASPVPKAVVPPQPDGLGYGPAAWAAMSADVRDKCIRDSEALAKLG